MPGVLGLDRLALVADFALALLELCLELGELRVTFVERGGAASQALVGLHARFEDLLLLGERRRQSALTRLSGGSSLRSSSVAPSEMTVKGSASGGRAVSSKRSSTFG